MKRKLITNLLLCIICSFLLNECYRNYERGSAEQKYFFNPIVKDGADPWVIRYNDFYYYCFSDSNKIWITKTAELENIGREKPAAVWSAVEGTNYSDEIWAPELHRINNKWYIYFAADDGDNNHHRLYVLEDTCADPQTGFYFKGRIKDSSDKWAIDGSVLQYSNKLYFIWSGWEGDINVQQNIYIAEMSNPWTISGSRVLISYPELSWEKIGDPLINEGPEVLQHNGRTFIVYSASGSWTDSYCLGMLALHGNDVLKKESWIKYSEPVFKGTDSVISPGHASFVKSPDRSEDWIVYHAAKKKGAGWDRNVRTQRFTWKGDSIPQFGEPFPLSRKIYVPRDNKSTERY